MYFQKGRLMPSTDAFGVAVDDVADSSGVGSITFAVGNLIFVRFSRNPNRFRIVSCVHGNGEGKCIVTARKKKNENKNINNNHNKQ